MKNITGCTRVPSFSFRPQRRGWRKKKKKKGTISLSLTKVTKKREKPKARKNNTKKKRETVGGKWGCWGKQSPSAHHGGKLSSVVTLLPSNGGKH